MVQLTTHFRQVWSPFLVPVLVHQHCSTPSAHYHRQCTLLHVRQCSTVLLLNSNELEHYCYWRQLRGIVSLWNDKIQMSKRKSKCFIWLDGKWNKGITVQKASKFAAFLRSISDAMCSYIFVSQYMTPIGKQWPIRWANLEKRHFYWALAPYNPMLMITMRCCSVVLMN